MRAYVHVPFCRQKCGYCKFALTPFVRGFEVDTYFAALEAEIGALFDAENELPPLETLYF
jgi:oxygen-independent coproporphyrinogen-3 oxidase